MNIPCPRCGNVISMPSETVGLTVFCRWCGREFISGLKYLDPAPPVKRPELPVLAKAIEECVSPQVPRRPISVAPGDALGGLLWDVCGLLWACILLVCSPVLLGCALLGWFFLGRRR